MSTLALLIAKSGIALWGSLPAGWEKVIVDYSRLDFRPVTFWSRPQRDEYEEIIIVDRGVVTALTQRVIELALRDQGIRGPVRYAGQVKTELGWLHQDVIVSREGVLIPRRDIHFEPSLMDRYLIALVGLPASGKTIIRKILAGLDGFSVYKWGKIAGDLVEERYGICDTVAVTRFTEEVERSDRLVVAREFLSRFGVLQDEAKFVVLDGIKSREQIIFVSYALRRPVIVVKTTRDEQERIAEAAKRGDFDDGDDTARLKLLAQMGAIEVMDFADFEIVNTGGVIAYDHDLHTFRANFTGAFLRGIHDLLSWLYISDSLEATRRVIANRSRQIAIDAGYTPFVEVADG
jgi:dephospho-CoA kinase